MQTFPTFRYHKADAPDGRLCQSQADLEALGEGWVETPAAFDPNYVAPPPSDIDDGRPSDAYAQTFVRVRFPSHRYARTGESILVQSQEEADALDPSEWKETPDPAAFGLSDDQPAKVLSFAPPAPVAPAPESVQPVDEPGTLGQPSDAEAKAAAELVAKARELHGTSVTDVLKALDGCSDASFLRKVKEMEMLNPDGPRVTLVRSIDSAIKTLETPAS